MPRILVVDDEPHITEVVSAYLLPYFRERTFAGVDGRLRSPLPVATDNAQYESSDEENHVDFALRYSHYLGSFDDRVHLGLTDEGHRVSEDWIGRLESSPVVDLYRVEPVLPAVARWRLCGGSSFDQSAVTIEG